MHGMVVFTLLLFTKFEGTHYSDSRYCCICCICDYFPSRQSTLSPMVQINAPLSHFVLTLCLIVGFFALLVTRESSENRPLGGGGRPALFGERHEKETVEVSFHDLEESRMVKNFFAEFENPRALTPKSSKAPSTSTKATVSTKAPSASKAPKSTKSSKSTPMPFMPTRMPIGGISGMPGFDPI